MKKTVAVCVLAIVSLGIALSQGSDFEGAYALIEKVVLEPNEQAPNRIQIFGVFAMANSADKKAGYLPPQRGYLYFALPIDDPRMSTSLPQLRREFADLKALAGTRKAVALGGRGDYSKIRVRKPDEKPASPDAYVPNLGLTLVRTNTDYAPIKSLLEFR